MKGVAAVSEVLPHRYPMLLVDAVLELVPGERLTAVKAITRNEPWYRDLGAQAGEEQFAYPETMLAESWAQATGLLASGTVADPDALRDKVMLIGSMSGIEFERQVFPGEVVRHRVRLLRELGDTMIFDGDCSVGADVVFTVSRMVVAFRPEGLLRPVVVPEQDHRERVHGN